MMALQPRQPTQPGVVGGEQLRDAAVEWFADNAPGDVAARRATGGVVPVCEPFCPGDIDEALTSACVTGAVGGIAGTSAVIEDQPWMLHTGAIAPYEEKSRGPGGGSAPGFSETEYRRLIRERMPKIRDRLLMNLERSRNSELRFDERADRFESRTAIEFRGAPLLSRRETYLLFAVPWIGWLAWLAAMWLGLGAMVLSGRRYLRSAPA